MLPGQQFPPVLLVLWAVKHQVLLSLPVLRKDPVQAILQELWVAALQKGSELAVFPVPPILPALQKELYPALQVYPLLPVSGLPVDH